MASGSGPTYRPDPWERLVDRDTGKPLESNPAWAAFVKYRDAGLERSLSKTATALGKSRQLLHVWSAKHKWAIRVGAYDRETDRMRMNALRSAHNRNADRMMATSTAMMQVVGLALQDYAGGEGTKAKALKAQDVARLAEVAVKLEAMVMGESLTIRHIGPGAQAGTLDHVDHLTDEDRVVRLRQLHAEIGSRLAGDVPVDEEAS